ncbi:MOSC domain-containing protein [Oceanobacillus saliphilus]|uniref:MOSC domain-containing protein n=1 Tax=Oceanobacillus saliphilus TaxID=2925834 RepID=UPI00201E1263|nr:MOSC domain-containing protein [Oceanobacillus saliphilus]
MEEPYVHKIFAENNEVSDPIFLKKQGFLHVTEMTGANNSTLDKAIFAYPIKHYPTPEEDVGDATDRIGAIGENFSVLEMDEFTVFIGDTFRMGEAIIQVSQPGPVSAKHLQNGLRTGWYFRVVKEGYIQEGTDLELLERPYPQWSIAACTEVTFLHKDDLRAADELYSCLLLGGIWRRTLKKRLRGF